MADVKSAKGAEQRREDVTAEKAEPFRWNINTTSKIYDLLQPVAFVFKVLIQMAVAVLAMYYIWKTFASSHGVFHGGPDDDFPEAKETLRLIGNALAVAAAAELAYTLFTDGPDEAVDPLLLGLAAALLAQVGAADSLSISQGGATLLYAVSLGILFAVRAAFVDRHGPNKKPSFSALFQSIKDRKAARPAKVVSNVGASETAATDEPKSAS